MGDVVIVEATQYVQDGIRLTNVSEELITKPFTLACALDQPSDVYDLYGRGDDALGVYDLCELIETLIGDGDHTDVRLDGTEGEVGGLCLRIGETVEEGRLPDIGKTHDTAL